MSKFDKLFILAVGIWLLVKWIMPGIFNTDSNLGLAIIYAIPILALYVMGRAIYKLFCPPKDEINKGDTK